VRTGFPDLGATERTQAPSAGQGLFAENYIQYVQRTLLQNDASIAGIFLLLSRQNWVSEWPLERSNFPSPSPPRSSEKQRLHGLSRSLLAFNVQGSREVGRQNMQTPCLCFRSCTKGHNPCCSRTIFYHSYVGNSLARCHYGSINAGEKLP
jgi:hypothetical protein